MGIERYLELLATSGVVLCIPAVFVSSRQKDQVTPDVAHLLAASSTSEDPTTSDSVPNPRQDPAKAPHVLRVGKSSIGKDGMRSQDPFKRQTGLLKHTRRSHVIDMANGLQPDDVMPLSQLHHAGHGLRGITLTPRRPAQHITG